MQEEDFDENDVPVCWGVRTNSDGELVTKITTVGDMEKASAERALLRPTFDSFKEQYIDKSFRITEQEGDLLVDEAPSEIKKWFDALSHDSKPLLVYGAYGVGKTMTAQALVKRAGMTLCYVPFPDMMEVQWNKDQFEPKYLNDIDGPVCVVVDGIEQLPSSYLTNLYRLVDLCGSKEKLNLLAIAYHAKKHMPKVLYDKFQSVKFPMPSHDKKMKILRSNLEKRELAPDIDDAFLNKLVDEIPHCTPRTLENTVETAMLYVFSRREQLDQKIILTKSNFVESIKKMKIDEKMLKLKFDECE